MIKLNRPVEMLEDILEKIEAKMEAIQDRINYIEENAADRDLSCREHNRILTLMEQIEDLQGEADEIENALDYLRDYTEY